MRFIVLCLLLFSFPSRAACAEDSLKIGVLASLTGNWAQIGTNITQGVKLAAEELNAADGVLGKQLRFEIQDTDEEKSGAKVVTAYRFLQNSGIKYFIGPTGVPGIMALTPLAAKDDMVLVAPTSTNSFYKDSKKFFNASGDNYLTTKAAAVQAFNRGFRRAAVFGSLQPWENDQAKIFKQEFSALGGKIVAQELPQADQTDLRIEATRIIQSKPDAIFYAIFNNIALAAKALRQQHFTGPQFAALLDTSHLTGSDGALEGTQLYLFDPPAPAFVEKYRKRYGEAPGVFADSAYDAALSLGTAINAAGTLDREKVISSMHSISILGSGGKQVRYDAEGLLSRGISLNEVRDGNIVVLRKN